MDDEHRLRAWEQAIDRMMSLAWVSVAYALFTLAALAFLSGCARPDPEPVCPTIAPWSRDDQMALMRALDADQSAVIHRAVREDAGFRAWARACHKGV